MNILLICTYNKFRSRSAENIYKDTPGINVRSAGISSQAIIKLNTKLIEWADVIFCMEQRHTRFIDQFYRDLLTNKKVFTLDITDQYHYMDPELVELIKSTVDPILETENII